MTATLNYHGKVSWWGLSPAIDYLKLRVGAINVLQIGAGDIRHLMKTLSELSNKSKPLELNIFIIEPHLENIARQVLLWSVILEQEEKLSIPEKAEIFLEIFGNSYLPPKTELYMADKCSELISSISGSSFGNVIQSVNLEQLKHSERDCLEEIFRMYRAKDHQFDITAHWNHRLRWHTGPRYDVRSNIFDWDYHMKLKERGVQVVHQEEYFRWRETGLAFKFGQAECVIPNKTLCSNAGAQANGKGYCGDMQTGPFVAFGIQADDEKLFEKVNGLCTSTSQDVSFHNVSSIIEEMNKNPSLLQNFQINYCTPNVRKFTEKEKHKNAFDVIYFGRNSIHLADSTVASAMSKNGILIAETSKFILEWNKEGIHDVLVQTEAILSAAGLKLAEPCNPMENTYATFIKE